MAQVTAAKRGRPPKAAEDKRCVRIEVRGTAEEVATIEAGARAAGKPVSVFVCEAAVAKVHETWCGYNCECCEYGDGTAPIDHTKRCALISSSVDGCCSCEGAEARAKDRKRVRLCVGTGCQAGDHP